MGQEWNPYGVDPSGDPDTQPAGSGGDPYAGAPPDLATPETVDLGTMPGGDSQLSPLSPNQGFDWTDTLGGTPPWMQQGVSGGPRPGLPQGRSRRRFSLFGPGGVVYDSSSSPDLPNLGVYPGLAGVPDFLGGGAPSAANLGPPGSFTGMNTSQSVGAIVRWVRMTTGMRVSAKSLVALIVRYGFPAVAKLTGLAFQQLLILFMARKGVTHHHRGPGLYTIAKKLRRADSLRAMVRRICGPGLVGHHHYRARAPYHHFRRKKR